MYILAAYTEEELKDAGFPNAKKCTTCLEILYCVEISIAQYTAITLIYDEYQDGDFFDKRGIFIFGRRWQWLDWDNYQAAKICL